MFSGTPMMNRPQSVGEALVALLADYGVEMVFGIPGTHSIELYRGLEGSPVRHISPRHEQGGGFMADGYARVSGKPGVCFVITGPGVTNLSTPLGEAYMDSVPMLVISPVNDPDPDGINRGRLHEITSQSSVTKPLTAFSRTVRNADEIPELVKRAFDLFHSERPRPVHISIPLHILPEPIPSPWKATAPEKPGKAGTRELNTARELIENAVAPVLVIGGGTTADPDIILRLADRVGCPVLSTVAARGVIPDSHPLSAGAQLRAPHVQDVLEQADLGIFLGTEFAQTDHWNDDLRLPGQQIWVNLCPTALDQRGAALAIKADCIDFATRLAEQLDAPDPARMAQTLRTCESARNLHGSGFSEKEKIHWAVLQTILPHLPDQATITSDMTQLAYTAVDYLPMARPNQWLHPTGYGTLGYALPAAIGAALADPSRPVLVIVGDAGLQYTMQEMTLASELGLHLVVLLWNNDALQQICDDMDHAGIERIGIFQRNPDFVALARACGWTARQCSGLSTLGAELEEAFDSPGPTLVKLDESSIQV